MPFKIVRNDITKMNTEAIVNTANDYPTVGTGCDHAVYEAAGYDELLAWRKENVGYVKEGDAFISPGFRLPAKYIIHAVSPLYIDGKHNEEELLRSCYRKSLALAERTGIRSIAFPLISTGGFGYPKEEGMRIAVDEIHAFLLTSKMEVFLVVFGETATRMGKNLYPDLESYIDIHYVRKKNKEEYGDYRADSLAEEDSCYNESIFEEPEPDLSFRREMEISYSPRPPRRPGRREDRDERTPSLSHPKKRPRIPDASPAYEAVYAGEYDAVEEMERKLSERMEHMSDTFQQYLFYLIKRKGMGNAEVYKRAIVDKKVFSKIKNNPDYHPMKLTALCLCIGAKLNMDETRDLLSRAGYALSPCDKTDIIFSFFIENEIYDMIELDIQLEEHGLPCIIT